MHHIRLPGTSVWNVDSHMRYIPCWLLVSLPKESLVQRFKLLAEPLLEILKVQIMAIDAACPCEGIACLLHMQILVAFDLSFFFSDSHH